MSCFRCDRTCDGDFCDGCIAYANGDSDHDPAADQRRPRRAEPVEVLAPRPIRDLPPAPDHPPVPAAAVLAVVGFTCALAARAIVRAVMNAATGRNHHR